jgi:hypothetical protein
MNKTENKKRATWMIYQLQMKFGANNEQGKYSMEMERISQGLISFKTSRFFEKCSSIHRNKRYHEK